MQQRISLNGSAFVDSDELEHHQQVAFLVYGEVARVGQASNQSQGDYEFRNVTMQGLVLLEGAEGSEAVERIKTELDLADAATVNGALADDDEDE